MQATSADAVLRALADPHRRQILRLVRGGELAAGEIASHFDATQQAVSHHLQVLAKSGLLSERRDGARRLYALDPEALDPLREVLSELWPSALERLKHVVEENRNTEDHGAEASRSAAVTDPKVLTAIGAHRCAARRGLPLLRRSGADRAVARRMGRPAPRTGWDLRPRHRSKTPVRGAYVEVDPPRRVVFTWGVAGRDTLPPGSTTVEVVLTADGSDTVVELFHHDLPDDAFDSHRGGWVSKLDDLVRAVA